VLLPLAQLKKLPEHSQSAEVWKLKKIPDAEGSGILRHPRVFKGLISDGTEQIIRVQRSVRIYI
jgi:hypothetical protein